jgi:hypothetical protein
MVAPAFIITGERSAPKRALMRFYPGALSSLLEIPFREAEK